MGQPSYLLSVLFRVSRCLQTRRQPHWQSAAEPTQSTRVGPLPKLCWSADNPPSPFIAHTSQAPQNLALAIHQLTHAPELYEGTGCIAHHSSAEQFQDRPTTLTTTTRLAPRIGPIPYKQLHYQQQPVIQRNSVDSHQNHCYYMQVEG